MALPMYGMLSPRRVCDVCYVTAPLETVSCATMPQRWEANDTGDNDEEEEISEKVLDSEQWY